MVAWYTLNGPGWRNGALLDSAQAPRPVYTAYRYLIGQAQGGVLPPAMIADYGANVEAYRFSKRSHAIDVVWSVDGTARTVNVPLAKFMGASDRNGNSLETSIVGAEVRLRVGFSPIYIRRLP
jgi:hypothetical protein